MYKDIPDPTSPIKRRLLFRYDQERALVEVKGLKGLLEVDLKTLEVKPASPKERGPGQDPSR